MKYTLGIREPRPITTSYVATETQRALYEDELPRAIADLIGERGPFYLPVFPCELQSQLYETAPVCRPEGRYQFGPGSFFAKALWHYTVEQIWLANPNARWGELIDKPDSGLVQAMSSISRFGMRLIQGYAHHSVVPLPEAVERGIVRVKNMNGNANGRDDKKNRTPNGSNGKNFYVYAPDPRPLEVEYGIGLSPEEIGTRRLLARYHEFIAMNCQGKEVDTRKVCPPRALGVVLQYMVGVYINQHWSERGISYGKGTRQQDKENVDGFIVFKDPEKEEREPVQVKSTPGSVVSGTAKRCYEGREIRYVFAGQTEFEQGLRVLENHPLDRYFSHLLMMMWL